MRKLALFVLVLCLIASLAAQTTPDPTKIPHYFGPYPNWANSPFATVDANILFADGCGGTGTGAAAVASVDRNGTIQSVTVTNHGDGYTCAPTVTVNSAYGSGAQLLATLTPSNGVVTSIALTNGGANYFYPLVTINGDGTGATADAVADPYTGAVTGITITNPGTGYTKATVQIDDWGGTGTGALATATVSPNLISVQVVNGGTGYKTPGGIRKFVDGLPGLGPKSANNLGQYISVATPDTQTYPGADYYEIAVIEYTKQLHSDLPATKLRGYIQLNNGTDANGQNTIAPDKNPQFLGATIIARKNRPVRILFKNLLPTGAAGNLFLPVDATMMGAGMGPMMAGMNETNNNDVYDGVRNPMCGVPGTKPMGCYTENRAVLHLHGGTTPWISDGTPHQWITPAGDTTSYSKGVSVAYVPDMWYDASGATIAECAGQSTCAVAGATNDPGPGAQTYYYTNQQSARLLFYHDHSWGITRLNVYAGEAAGYLITDDTEQKLIAPGAPLADVGLGTPLIIQDRTFVPSADQLSVQDPTWDAGRWGTMGNFWYHHVYMPAQNPFDPAGVSPYGRWMYGPWFWPPAGPDTTPYQPIPNPYYDATCTPDTAPNGFCEPAMIPGTPNISVGMEQFNDTPLVNGTPYPTMTVEPKAYRFRILNAANDRFFNLQWYVADASGTEVALKADEVAAALNDPNVFPTPDTNKSPVGPSWLQIGNEAGFLPSPVVVPNQPITWITDPTRFDFGNVDQHAMLVAPAERADVIVDFSKYAGKTLILYNDAPAAFPARQASYDYYTGDADNSDIGGAPTTIPGFGPNTRTVMQVVVGNSTPAVSFNPAPLVAAFQHNASGTGVFESSQHPIIVGQAGYNKAYGTSFTNNGYCSSPTSTTKCDGLARIQQQGGDPFTFDTLSGNKLSLTIEPKALHDEMNAVSFDAYGRMMANLGVEAVPATAGLQNVTLYPYVNPPTELIDTTNLPKGLQVSVTPISTASDGTQIWKITHNGVDTHPIHFHLFDVQVINRVTWDNIIIPADANELGWKDTVRVSPLEDTLVALRPVVPTLPFQLPNSIRPMNPMLPLGATMGFNSIDANGNPTPAITNDLVNFGWEYVWHCHILSHEEMDMMRPIAVANPPAAPSNLSYTVGKVKNTTPLTLTWMDNSLDETSFIVQRQIGTGAWTGIATIPAPLGAANTTGQRSYTDASFSAKNVTRYRVVAVNTVGYGGSYMSKTAQSTSNAVTYSVPPTVSATTTPALPASGWYTSGVTAKITGTGATTVSSISYTLNGVTKTVAGSTASVFIGSQGTSTLTYFAVDANGASSTVGTLTVKIDSAPPAIAATSTPASVASGTGSQTVTVTGTITDSGSGVTTGNGAGTYTVKNAAGSTIATGTFNITSTGAFTFSRSISKTTKTTYTITMTASDKAGNNATKSVTFTVI